MGIEEPKYAVSLHEGAYEVRDYQAAVAAEVSVTGDQRAAARKGFRLLAGCIFGGNRRHQSIAMTAPVAQERTGADWWILDDHLENGAASGGKDHRNGYSKKSVLTVTSKIDVRIRAIEKEPSIRS